MGLNIANCPRCGKVFAKGVRDVCPACYSLIEHEYDECIKYLREHKGANIHELSEAVDVSVRQITRFIREGRISLMNNPNLAYPCESCGILIREGSICDECRNRIAADVRMVKQQDARKLADQQAMKRALTYKIDRNDR